MTTSGGDGGDEGATASGYRIFFLLLFCSHFTVVPFFSNSLLNCTGSGVVGVHIFCSYSTISFHSHSMCIHCVRRCISMICRCFFSLARNISLRFQSIYMNSFSSIIFL